MKFTTERDSFADAVAWVSRTVSTRPTLPVLGGTLLELTGQRLRLASTDLEHTGEAVIEVRGETDGKVVVPGRIFGDVVRNLPSGVVEVQAVDGGLTVRCGQVSHELRLLDAEDFPSLTQPSLENSATLPGDVLAAAAGQVARAASHDEARPVLTAVLFEAEPQRLTLAATDSYRLAVRDLDWTWAHTPTICRPALSGLHRPGSVGSAALGGAEGACREPRWRRHGMRAIHGADSAARLMAGGSGRLHVGRRTGIRRYRNPCRSLPCTSAGFKPSLTSSITSLSSTAPTPSLR